jgi:2-succinyl-6-hydroxy-2,4-cyclohexadiene-1-carboxylate synthase
VNALLALHGFTGSPESWDFAQPSAGQLFAPALLGHAGADAATEITHFEGEVARLSAFLPANDTLHVIGYSLGARLALGIALDYPERVARLTLISGHPGLATEAERSARRAADAAWIALLLARGVPAFVAAWQAQPLWATQTQLPKAAQERKRAERLRHSASGLARSLRVTGLGEMPNYCERLGELRMPVTLLAGALDPKFCALAQGMAERLAQPTLEIVPAAGHDLLLERPEFVTRVIRRGNQT